MMELGWASGSGKARRWQGPKKEVQNILDLQFKASSELNALQWAGWQGAAAS